MKKTTLSPINVTSMSRTVIDGQEIVYYIAESLEIAGYLAGKKNKLKVYAPIACIAEVMNPFEDDLDPITSIIVSRKYANKPKKLAALLTYFGTIIRPTAVGRRAVLNSAITGVNGPNPEDNEDVVLDGTEYDAKILAYIEATALHGYAFTGIKVFGLRFGGVMKQIQKDETKKLEKVSSCARRDYKRATKTNEPWQNRVARKFAESQTANENTEAVEPQK